MTTDNDGAMLISEFAALVERGDFEISFGVVITNPPVPAGYIPVILHVLGTSAVFAAYNPDTKMLRPFENIDNQWLPDISMNIRRKKNTTGDDIKRCLLQDKPYIFNLTLIGAALMTLTFNERTYTDRTYNDRP